jgi:selenocysteine lyase/cysteine desulfurase
MIRVVDLDGARAEWAPEGTYLNTASYGLPPARAWSALQEALADWRGGRTSWEGWNDTADVARASFARIVGAPAERVAVGATASGLVGLIAAAVPDGARVLTPDVEFTSLLYPFMVQSGRGVDVRTVPADRLAEAIDADTDVVAFSAVQMSTGEVADLDAVAAAARHHGALTVVDASQACGWLPLDAAGFDAVACAGFKWLVGQRGTAFLTVAPDLLERIVPHAAGWYAAEDPEDSFAGPPLRLARSARRLDTAPAWFSWVATAPALAMVEEIGVPAIHAHDVGLANAFRAGLGLPPSDSAIVLSDLDDGGGDRLAEAGVMAAVIGGRLRTAWHLYNTPADVERALAVVGP